jgi:plastocyanin domain-containing protein
MSRLTLTLFTAATMALPFAASAQMHDHSAMSKDVVKTAAAPKAPKTIEITMSNDGVSPRDMTATKGEPLRLAITRKTNATCATQLVMQDYGINQPLPLNKTVVVDFTPKASGKIRLLCGMGETIAVVTVQ